MNNTTWSPKNKEETRRYHCNINSYLVDVYVTISEIPINCWENTIQSQIDDISLLMYLAFRECENSYLRGLELNTSCPDLSAFHSFVTSDIDTSAKDFIGSARSQS